MGGNAEIIIIEIYTLKASFQIWHGLFFGIFDLWLSLPGSVLIKRLKERKKRGVFASGKGMST
jgi:hypothetical protein